MRPLELFFLGVLGIQAVTRVFARNIWSMLRGIDSRDALWRALGGLTRIARMTRVAVIPVIEISTKHYC